MALCKDGVFYASIPGMGSTTCPSLSGQWALGTASQGEHATALGFLVPME